MQHNQTKVTLSKDELSLVINAQILLTKNEIVKKVYTLFGLIADNYVLATTSQLPETIVSISPKISRGENYKGLPYVMLDYPRYFKKEETFAIRTLFWWGNFFSITLQLSGDVKDTYLPILQTHILQGDLENWYISNGDDEWEHHFEDDNYEKIKTSTDLSEKKFIKIATKIPLGEWDHANNFLLQNFSFLIRILTSNTMK